MPKDSTLNLWRETVSSKTVKDTFKGMYLMALHQAKRQNPSKQFFTIHFEIQDFVLCESKGILSAVTSLALPTRTGETLWICLQFHGKTAFPSGKVTEPNTMFSFMASTEEWLPTLAAERQWVLCLGISGASKEQLLTEIPSLRKQYGSQQIRILPATPLSYPEKRIMENFSKSTFGPFSTLHQIGRLTMQLYGSYTQQLLRYTAPPREGQIELYHRAIAYIRDHYMDGALNSEKIADALYCSVRSLTRAFEGRPLSLNNTILTLRLYKGRELLRTQTELSVEQVALSLHFSDAKHFAVQYKKYFHRTPRQDRKAIDLRKE